MGRLSADWKRRKVISISNPAAVVLADVEITIPKDFDSFWDSIDSNGHGIRVCGADGQTILDYDIVTDSGGVFNVAAVTAKDGKIRLKSAPMPFQALSVSVAFLYFDPEAAPTDGSTAGAIGASVTGHIELGRPSWERLTMRPGQVGNTVPDDRISKTTYGEIFVWLDMTPALERRQDLHGGGLEYEEVAYALFGVYDTTPTIQPGMVAAQDMRVVETVRGGRRTWVRVRLKSGSAGSNYTGQIKVGTAAPNDSSTHRTIDYRFGIQVQDQAEST